MNIHNIHVRATELYTQSFAEFGVGFAPPTLTVAQVRAVLQALVELDEPEEVAQPEPQPTADKPKRKLPRNTSPEHMQRMREARMAKRQQRLQQEAPAPSPEPATEGPTAEPEGESR